MVTPIPQSKTSELIDSLNEMLHSGIDREAIAEIMEEANKLKSIGMTVHAFNVLGMVASLKLDLDEVDRLFKAALLASGRDAMTLRNYAVALANAYCYQRALEIIDEAVATFPDDISIVTTAQNLHQLAFDADGANKMTELLNQFGIQSDEVIPTDDMTNIRSAISKSGATWSMVSDRICLAATAVAKAGKRANVNFEVHDGAIIYNFVIDSSVEDVIKAEDAMIDELAKAPFTAADRVLYFSCSCA